MNTEYYQCTKSKEPTKLLVKALQYVINKGQALDIGAGALVDSKHLLSLGFKVTAIDINQEVEDMAKDIQDPNLIFYRKSMESFNYPENTFDIINASFSLPFINQEDFPQVFADIKKSLKPQGILVCHLFGLNDEWNIANNKLTFHSREEVDDLLSNMNIISLSEKELDGQTGTNVAKHWHVFYIIAQKD